MYFDIFCTREPHSSPTAVAYTTQTLSLQRLDKYEVMGYQCVPECPLRKFRGVEGGEIGSCV